MSWYEIQAINTLLTVLVEQIHDSWSMIMVRSIQHCSQLTQIGNFTKKIQNCYGGIRIKRCELRGKENGKYVKYGEKKYGETEELTEYMSNPPPLPTFIHQKLFHMNAACLFRIKRHTKREKQRSCRNWGRVDEYNIGAAGIVHTSQLLAPALDLFLSFWRN